MTNVAVFWDGFFWFPAVAFPLFWIGMIVVVVVLLTRDRSHPHGRWPMRHESSALQLLEERYARGEISREEFLERRAVLLQTRTPTRPDPGAPTVPLPPAAPSGPSEPGSEPPAAPPNA